MLNLDVDVIEVNKYADKLWKHIYNQLNRVINTNGLNATKKRKHIKLSSNEKKFLQSINSENKIKEILTANLPKMRSLIKQYEKKFSNLRIKTNGLNRILYNVFVSNVYENNDRFDGLKFVEDLKLKTCPYCNRSYINSVSKNGIIRPQIDHFYPKSQYPYLGLSFYNLIPSCSVCNGTTAKGDKDSYKDNLISPYEINEDDFKFSFDVISTQSFMIKFDKKLTVNDNYFKLEEFYKHHSDVVNELYVKLKQENTKEHFDSLRQSLSGISFDMEDVYKLITCGYFKKEDFHKRPLSKLIKDVSEELGLIDE